MMLLVTFLLTSISSEAMSTAYVIAFLAVGPLAALLGGMLYRADDCGMCGPGLARRGGHRQCSGGEASDRSVEDDMRRMSPRAPKELNAFAFLIGTWDGTGRTRLPDGKVAEYPVTWIGRYVLDGTAIADEVHGPAPDGSPTLGISFSTIRLESSDVQSSNI